MDLEKRVKDEVKQVVDELLNAVNDLRDFVNGPVFSHTMFDSTEAASIIADTNAFDWELDEVEVSTLSFIKAADVLEGIIAKLSWHGGGSPSQDHIYCGHEARGEATLRLNPDGSYEITDVSGEIVDYADRNVEEYDEPPECDEPPGVPGSSMADYEDPWGGAEL